MIKNDNELTGGIDPENPDVYMVKWHDNVIAAHHTREFASEDVEAGIIEYYNAGYLQGIDFCRRFPKAAKKRRIIKKWVKRFGAKWGLVDANQKYKRESL